MSQVRIERTFVADSVRELHDNARQKGAEIEERRRERRRGGAELRARLAKVEKCPDRPDGKQDGGAQ